MRRWLWRVAAPLVAVTLLSFAQIGRAHTVTVQFDTGLSSGTNFVYDIFMTAGASLKTASTGANDFAAPDYFSIYDFAGLQSYSWTPGALTAAAWSFYTETVNSTNPGVAVPDNLTPNFRADFVGGVYTAPATPDQTLLGTLTLVSSYTSRGIAKYISSDSEGLDPTYNVGTTTVAVPLPATANMGLALIACLGGYGAWRRMKGTQELA